MSHDPTHAPGDPFRYLPTLRDKIVPFAQSSWRTFTKERVAAILAEQGIEPFPAYEDDVREAIRAEALAGHTGDLWVFGYGSLIWDPALDFSEVRQAFAPLHQRRFILVDIYGGRGTRDAPGLMAALDRAVGGGQGCNGLAFRIPAEKVEAETEILFRREAIGPGYHARHIPVQIDGQNDGQIKGQAQTALTFVADHDAPLIMADVTREAQIRYAATGTGFLGTSLEYLQNTLAHLDEFGIHDADAHDLLKAALAFQANLPTP